jgi:transcriptional antiterminator NusG
MANSADEGPAPYRKGQTVKLRQGPFAGQAGTIDEVLPEARRVIVHVSAFGKQVPVEAMFADVERVSS